jgi:hypothetical protein
MLGNNVLHYQWTPAKYTVHTAGHKLLDKYNLFAEKHI